MARAELDYKEFDNLMELMIRAAQPEPVINDVLHGFGAEEIEQGIQKLLPQSGRNWTGKKAPASAAQPFTRENGNLSVTVKTKKAYHYLYFPDDGTNTKHHAGNQQFMLRGAESKSEGIAGKIAEKLVEQIEGGI